MEIQPFLGWCKCSGTYICPFCKLLVVGGVTVAALFFGYWMGRQSKGKPPENPAK
ncbi:MAG TPA: hypothetical protein PKL97_08355 [Candidatus Omnitrophota bacterium]|nr:hypothetical protein [Candidatus Omnitrophota bacterium]